MSKIINIKDDGLGYDNKLKQYYLVCYAWKYVNKENTNSKHLTLKSGITKHNVNHAMKSSAPTRGKMYPTLPLWGFDSDRMYLPKKIDRTTAAKIVTKADNLFKTTMDELTKRYQTGLNDIGTEFYVGDKNTLLSIIKENWQIAINSAIIMFTKQKVNTNSKQIEFRGEQWKHPEIIQSYLDLYDRGIIIAPCGTGKSLRMWLDLNIVSWFSDKKINVLFAPTIKATQQLCIRHNQYSEDTIYDNIWKSVIVCSDIRNNPNYNHYGIETTSASDIKLKILLEEAFTQPGKFLFYVNMHSGQKFWEVYKKLQNKYKFTEKPGVILDEVHRYAGNKNKINTSPIVKANTNCVLGYTATPNYRKVNSKSYINNSDEKYFGKLALEIKPHDAIDQGLNSEIVFDIIEVYDKGDLANEILKNKNIAVFFKRKAVEIKGNLLRVIPAIQSAIKNNKKHIYIPTSRKQNVIDLIRLVELCQKYGFIDSEYQLIRGLIDDKGCFDTLQKTKKGIIFCTRWSIESLDYPFIKCIIPMNNFSSPIDADQCIGRGQRPFNDEILNVYIPISPLDKNNTLIQVAHNKITNVNTIVDGNHDIKKVDIDLTGPLGAKQNAVIRVNHQPDPSTPANYSILMKELVDTIGTEKFGEVLKSWRAKLYTDEEIIESAAPHGTPNKWRIVDESIYFHAYNRKEQDDIWERATAHMTHRTSIDVDKRMKQLFKAIDECKGKVWAFKTFNKKYPQLLNWLKSNPKQITPKIWNCKVVDINILPFVAGKFGHITKEYLLQTKKGCQCMTDWANKIGYTNQNSLQIKCDSLKVSYKDLLLSKEQAAIRNGKLSILKKKK